MTSQKPEYRWGIDGRRYIECPYFWNAIQKYGWDNFSHHIIATGLTRDEAIQLERDTIAALNTQNPVFGYNLSAGGDGPDPDISRSVWKNEETKAHAIKRMREAWKDPEKRERRSRAAKKRWANPEFKEFATQRVAEACAKPVRCTEGKKCFGSITEAANYYGIISSNISRAIKTGYKCGGYHWEYIDNAS